MKKTSLVLLVFVMIFFAKVVIAPPTHVLSVPGVCTDTYQFFYQWRHNVFETIKDGRLPFWNRYVFCGYPSAAETQTAVFYPLNALFLIFRTTAQAINWSFILHIFLSGLGMLFFLNELKLSRVAQLCGGLTYAFSAPLIGHIPAGHLSIINTAAWVGFIFFALERIYRTRQMRNGALLGIFLGLQITSGHIQYVFYTMIACAAYGLFLFTTLFGEDKKSAFRFLLICACGIVIAFGLSAVQLFPTMEYTALSSRKNLSYEFCADFSFPPLSLLTIFMPEFFGNFFHSVYISSGFFWEMCAYAGVIGVCLALFSITNRYACPNTKKMWVFVFLGVMTCILSLGENTPLFKLLYDWMPGFNLFRGTSKFIFLTAFSLAVLAGYGMEAYTAAPPASPKTGKAWPLGALLIGLAGIFFFLAVKNDQYALWKKIVAHTTAKTLYAEPLNLDNIRLLAATLFQSYMQFLQALALLAVFCLLLLRKNRKFGSYCLIGLLALDLWAFGQKYITLFDSQACRASPEVVAYLKKDLAPFRVVSTHITPNAWMVDKIEGIEGYGTTTLNDFKEFSDRGQGIPPDLKHINEHMPVRISIISKFFYLINLAYVILPAQAQFDFETLGFTPVYDDRRDKIYKSRNALERVFFVTRVVVLPHEKILAMISKSYFHPSETGIIEEDPPFPLDGEHAPAVSINILSYEDMHISLEVDNNADGLLIVSDAYYPGWHAYVNGRKEKIYKTDYFLRGVFLREGKNTVDFFYRPASVFYGGIISLLTVCIAISLVVLTARKGA